MIKASIDMTCKDKDKKFIKVEANETSTILEGEILIANLVKRIVKYSDLPLKDILQDIKKIIEESEKL